MYFKRPEMENRFYVFHNILCILYNFDFFFSKLKRKKKCLGTEIFFKAFIKY